jgi:methionyl-tRNA formyltransferase
VILERFFRALSPWPGVWTKITIQREQQINKLTTQQSDNTTKQRNNTEEKRLKILACHLQPTTNNLILDSVQLEGKKSVSWKQFEAAYLYQSTPQK